MTPPHRSSRSGVGGVACAPPAGFLGARQPRPAALALLDEAHGRLREAAALCDPCERYAAAHVAALRIAAAVLAARVSPPAETPVRRRPTSAWTLLLAAAPELAEWARFFAANAGRRAAAEAGVRDAATGREADELVRLVEAFLGTVETALGLLPRRAAHTRRAGVVDAARRRSGADPADAEQLIQARPS